MSMTDACQRDFFKICSFVSRCILVERCTTRSSLVQVRPDLLYFISRGANPFEYGRIRGDLSACGCAWRGSATLPRRLANTPTRRYADTLLPRCHVCHLPHPLLDRGASLQALGNRIPTTINERIPGTRENGRRELITSQTNRLLR